MKKFEGILICTDLDGTLLSDDKTISKQNLEAIEYFKSEGGIFTFVTGRMPFFCDSIFNVIRPNAPFGCINGGGLYDYRISKYVWTSPLDLDYTHLVSHALQILPQVAYQVNTFEKIYFYNDNDAMADFRRHTGMENITTDPDYVHPEVAKIVFADSRSETIIKLAELLASHPLADKFDFVRSEQTLYEILPKGATKGNVLKKLAAIIGIDMQKTVAIGDFNNDVSMIQAAGLGVAVSNACPEAKDAADYITTDNNHHAISAIINAIEKTDTGDLRIQNPF